MAYVESSQATANKFGAIQFSENATVGDEASAADHQRSPTASCYLSDSGLPVP